MYYTPISDLDYGTIQCYARNSVGTQKVPCIYQVVAAGEFVLHNLVVMKISHFFGYKNFDFRRSFNIFVFNKLSTLE